MKHILEIESRFTGAELHKHLCKAIHEASPVSRVLLRAHVQDITLVEQPYSVEAAIDYLVESYDLLPESRTPVRHAIKCILQAHGA